ELLSLIALPADLGQQGAGVEREDPIVGAGRNRQRGIEVVGRERAVDVLERDLLPLEDRAVGAAENRQQHLVRELQLERMPVDVEKRRELRARTVLEDVLPPWIARLRDAH